MRKTVSLNVYKIYGEEEFFPCIPSVLTLPRPNTVPSNSDLLTPG